MTQPPFFAVSMVVFHHLRPYTLSSYEIFTSENDCKKEIGVDFFDVRHYPATAVIFSIRRLLPLQGCKDCCITWLPRLPPETATGSGPIGRGLLSCMPGIFRGERAELAGGEFVVGFRRAAPGPDKLGRDGEQPGQLDEIAAL